ncbi:hypothetical protein TNCV_120011 [Trichonephila clavipes]|nr:hypothetical protein TNCV_120011 [Trichonephila clavipes]
MVGDPDNTKSVFSLNPPTHLAITRIAITGRLSLRGERIVKGGGLQSGKALRVNRKIVLFDASSTKLLFSDEESKRFQCNGPTPSVIRLFESFSAQDKGELRVVLDAI